MKRRGMVRAALRHGKARLHLRRRTSPGSSPGTIRVDPHAPPTVITVIAYGPDKFEERQIQSTEEIRLFLGKYPVVWINVDGLGNAAAIEQIGGIFGLHRLAMEDVVNVHQRAKVEPYGEQLFIVARMVSLNSRVATEQISMFLGAGFVVTFQEDVGDCLDPVRNRIRGHIGRIRDSSPDYLAYAILDAAVDHYYPVLERLGDQMEDLEDQILTHPNPQAIRDVHHVKRELLILRRAIWPHREMVSALTREPHVAIQDSTRIFLRDVYDHVIQIIDLTETYREIAADLLDLYLNIVNSRINETMRVLTIIATIFIPLTFIVGVYGMNFDFMPELHWRWGYYAVWAAMLLITLAMFAYFYARGWLGRASTDNDLPPISPADAAPRNPDAP